MKAAEGQRQTPRRDSLKGRICIEAQRLQHESRLLPHFFYSSNCFPRVPLYMTLALFCSDFHKKNTRLWPQQWPKPGDVAAWEQSSRIWCAGCVCLLVLFSSPLLLFRSRTRFLANSRTVTINSDQWEFFFSFFLVQKIQSLDIFSLRSRSSADCETSLAAKRCETKVTWLL